MNEPDEITKKLYFAAKRTLAHFNKYGMAKFNTIGVTTSTYGFMLEVAITEFENEYGKIEDE